ncbi:MAG: glycosyltransferase family 9 protein [Gammaproteobacteria bacterium]
MDPFRDQPLREPPHIAVFSSSKVGNFVVTIPLLRGLKRKYPGCVLDFYGSETTAEFEAGCEHIDFAFALYSKRDDFLEGLTAAVRERVALAGPYDLAINCDEFSELNVVAVSAVRPQFIAGAGLTRDFRARLDPGGDAVQRMLKDKDWNSSAFLERYRNFLTSNYIGEIFCRMAYVHTDFYALELPSQRPDFDVPDVLVHATATRGAKLWPIEHWLELARWCAGQSLTVGLVGSPPAVQQALYHSGSLEDELLARSAVIDLRGRTSLIQLAGAFEQARACVSVDAGPMHIAAAAGCPTIALFGNDTEGDGASPVHLWAPRMANVHRVASTYKCRVCMDNNFKNDPCLVDGHPCMSALPADAVIAKLAEILRDR